MVPPNPHFRPEPGFGLLYILGAGGFGREVAWLVEQCWGEALEKVFLVDKDEFLCPPIGGVPVRRLADVRSQRDARYIVAVGDPAHRRRAVALCEGAGLAPATLSHPRAEMSRQVVLGAGSIVCAGVIATVDIELGAHVHVNLDCTIGHDVRIGEFSTLSPGVHVSGRVHIGPDVFIGTGVNIINGSSGEPLVIGAGAVVAAGACVTREVEPGAMVAGVPAVRKR
ncbi:MAG: sugar O-acyltransferase, sialic acid O-acetyltransferase NeuD family [Ramlibacter sp.]|jgi:sugar O-acyltransferase (sialic acid O-acetyltransferase NeuD family)|nr:sugar O-acyltransferase, sialic acid O-acetyltransferase NeuD family [Ramlibacter sp.]